MTTKMLSQKEVYEICQGHHNAKTFADLKNFKPTSATMDNYHWYKRYLLVADTYAQFSKDPSTRTGAVIVDKEKRIVAAGFNGFPKGIEDTKQRLNDRKLKYKLILHAEENALLMAKQALNDYTMFVSPLPPCLHCCLLIIQSGITTVVAPNLSGELKKRWSASCEESFKLFKEANVKVILM